jgi:GNAT superfamily N-acetyltransferase
VILTSYRDATLLDAWEQLAAAYLDVFAEPPWNEDGSDLRPFHARLAAAVRQPGFRAILAWQEDAVEAFALGWVRQPPFPAGRAYDLVRRRLGDAAVERLLVGAFEVDELGVRTRARGRRLGARLLAGLVADAPDGRAWLLTSTDATATIAFYTKAGWHEAPALPDPGPGADRVTIFLSPGLAGANGTSG